MKTYKIFGLKFSLGMDRPSDDIHTDTEQNINEIELDSGIEEQSNVDITKPSNASGIIPPGRVSVPNDPHNIIQSLRGIAGLVSPSFRTEYIPLIRSLYKVNSDMSITVQDTFKLANTGHNIKFPYNSSEESNAMEEHLKSAISNWSNYTAGINGLVNKFIVQCLIGGAISIEAVPKNNLKGISTILFINPEDIMFRRLNDGVYHPYQINKGIGLTNARSEQYIKLNLNTFKYIAMYNDTDEPYGIPPFMAVLEALVTQKNMKQSFQQAMDLLGMVGFLEVLMDKPDRSASESEPAYARRLSTHLKTVKSNIYRGMKDGIVVGYKDDHEFKMNSTTKTLANLDKVWNMNQQSVANGLGSNGTLIGVNGSGTEGGTGILLSKMIAQLKNIQELVISALEFIYKLELQLAGFNCKGITVTFNTSTVSDEVKLQQALEYKIRNLISLYNQGIISQDDIASEMGYVKPNLPEPIAPVDGVSDPEDSAKKKKREEDKDKSDRRGRDKEKVVPKRHDQKTKPR